MAVTYKIHPAIGIARVGDSEEFYIEPATAGGLPARLDGKPFQSTDFRSGDGKLRRQAAQFEVYRYDEGEESVVRPGQDGVSAIEWTVHLANKKPIWYQFQTSLGESGYAPDHPLRNAKVKDAAERTAMIIDPGPRTLRGPDQRACFSRGENPDGYPMTFPPEDLKPYSIDTLGEIRTGAESELWVLGGHGRSGSIDDPPQITTYANNDGWWDDTSDGPVTAVLVMDDGRRVPVDVSSWVLVAPPGYAPQILNLVTLYDTIFDVFVRHRGYRPDIFRDGLWNRDYRPDYATEIRPILDRGKKYPWVVAIPPHPHAFDLERLGNTDPKYNGLRQYYFSVVRPPSAPNTFASEKNGYPMMPWLAGDNALELQYQSSIYLTVTDTQYFLLQQWARGKFRDDGAPSSPPGEALDQAVLENCVGGAFSPGIEMTWVSRLLEIYSEPFRIHRRPDVQPPLSLGEDFDRGLEPGDVTKYMAVPWQADFNECSTQHVADRWIWWWPAQRPLWVYTHDHQDGKHRQVPWVGTDRDQKAPDYVNFADDLEMVEKWNRLGFVYNEGSAEKPFFVEVERTLPRRGPRRGSGGDGG